MENKDMVTIFCYGTTETLPRKEAIKKYTEGVVACEGCEKERYANILADLVSGKTLAIDDYDEYEMYNGRSVN